jgi:hypothetical protein
MKQIIPIILTIFTCALLIVILFLFIVFLNNFPTKEKILLVILPLDVFVGLTIYLKTSIDFVIFIGNLMKRSPGVINRIAIELGTAFGNGLGTLVVLTIWTFFKEVPILMIIMILLASLVLLRMAEDSFEEFQILNFKSQILVAKIKNGLKIINSFFDPLIKYILPHPNIGENKNRSFSSLFMFSLTIPFVLGLDDFAGYIPLFSIINVFGFAIGVFIGHMILNILLFASPQKTIKLITLPVIILAGAVAFVGLALFGFYEVYRIAISIISSS